MVVIRQWWSLQPLKRWFCQTWWLLLPQPMTLYAQRFVRLALLESVGLDVGLHPVTSFVCHLSGPHARYYQHDYVITQYHQTSNISCTLVDNTIVDHSDVVGASPVGAAPITTITKRKGKQKHRNRKYGDWARWRNRKNIHQGKTRSPNNNHQRRQ